MQFSHLGSNGAPPCSRCASLIMPRPKNAASAVTRDSAEAETHSPDDCEDSLRASVDADAPIVDQAWTAPLCETPGCDRMPNESHRYCCKECKRSRGQRHTPRCERLETLRRFHTRYIITMASCSRSPSPSPRAKAVARQLFDAALWLLHGDGAESAPTSTSIEPDQPPTPTSRAVDAPSAE